MKQVFSWLILWALLVAPVAQAGPISSYESAAASVREIVNSIADKLVARRMLQGREYSSDLIAGTTRREAHVLGQYIFLDNYSTGIYELVIAIEQTAVGETRLSVKILVDDIPASTRLHQYLSDRLVQEIDELPGAVGTTARDRVAFRTTYGDQVTVNLTQMAESEAQSVIRTVRDTLDTLLNEGLTATY